MNIILSNAPINNGNRGVGALTYSSIYLIDEICKRNKIDYQLYLTDSSLSPYSQYSVKIAGREVEIKTFQYPPVNILSVCKRLLLDFSNLKKDLKILKNAICVFDVGQGDSFSDIYGVKRFNRIFQSHITSHKLNKKLCLLPQTIGPFENKEIEIKALKSINKSGIVLCRDKQSYDYCRKISDSERIYEAIDVAFFMPFEKKIFNNKEINIGINVSALLWNGGYTRNNQFNLKCDYKNLVREIITYFLTLDNVKVHLIPHVVDRESNIENDYEVSIKLVEEYDTEKCIISPLFLNPISAKNYISGMDFFIGARMHSTIAAFSSNVPVVPLAYSRKFNGLFVDTLAYEYMGDMCNQTNTEVIKIIKDAFEERAKLTEIVKNRMNSIVKEKYALIVQNIERALL